MLTRQIWFIAVAMALMTTAASALPIPMYKVVVLPNGSGANTASAATAAVAGQQGGVFEFGRFTFACAPVPNPTACTANRTHAALWTQNGTRAFDLNPHGFYSSTLAGMTTTMQVGYGYPKKPAYEQQVHALLWLGSAHSAIDLNQPKFL